MQRIKKIISLVMTLLIVVSVVPAVRMVSAIESLPNTYVEAVNKLTCAGFIQNEENRTHVETMMKYHLLSVDNNFRIYRNIVENGNSAVFFFEGCSDNAVSKEYSDWTAYRTHAVCIVVKAENGIPVIKYYNSDSTTLPDNPRKRDLNFNKGNIKATSNVPTLKDGIYNIVTTNHNGYASLQVRDGSNINAGPSAVRCNFSDYYTNEIGSGINIHAKSWAKNIMSTIPVSNSYSSGTNGTRNSTGCLNVGLKDYNSGNGYNKFIEIITGKTNAINSAHSTIGKDMGVLIVDRRQYISQMEEIYTFGCTAENCEDQAKNIVKSIAQYTNDLISSGKIESQNIFVPPTVKHCPVSLSISNNVTGFQNYEIGQTISISWDKIENAQTYTIKALSLTGDPGHLYYGDNSEAGEVITLAKISDTEYQIPGSYAVAGKALKVAVAANYEDGTQKWSIRYIRINPDKPQFTSISNGDVVSANTDLTVSWDGATGAELYEYKVIELENNEPDPTSDSEPARNVIFPLSRTYEKEITINGDYLPSGRTFKMYLAAIGKDNTMSSKTIYFKTDGVETNVALEGISFESESMGLYPGSTTMIRPVFTPSNASDKVVYYSSNNEAVATVDADGIVTAVSAGMAVISALSNDGNYTASYTLNVLPSTAENWLDQYNPNKNNKITPEIIQRFLESYGGSLDNYTTIGGQTMVTVDGTNLDLGFDDYFAHNNTVELEILKNKSTAQVLSPAEIIYYSCLESNVNVVYILAKLQQEQSLIEQPATAKKLGCAAGYLKISKEGRTHYQPGEKYYGFHGQIKAVTHQNYLYVYRDGYDMATAYDIYTPSSEAGNRTYESFMSAIYNPYAAKFDELLGKTTVVSDNPLFEDDSFQMIYPETQKSVVGQGDLFINWTPNANADYYMISMRDVTDGENEDSEKLIINRQRVDDEYYTIHGSYFEIGRTYKIAVGAYTYSSVNEKGYEKWITPHTYVTVNASGVIGSFGFISPVNNSQAAENSAVTVAWSNASNAEYYVVNMRDLTTDTKLIDNLNIGNQTSYTIPVADEAGNPVLVSGHRYRVAVAAMDNNGNDKWANPHLQFSVAGDNEVGTNPSHGILPSGYTGIYSVDDLNNIRNNLSGNYILMNNIDASDVSSWTAIGTAETPFTGVFNGNGYSITNLCSSSLTDEYTGLFGYSEGEITNLNLTIASSGNWAVGGIAAINTGVISDCVVNGSVRNTSSTFDNQNGHIGSFAGGIVAINNGTVKNCVSNATAVTVGNGVIIGSLAGQNGPGALISGCYATGNVSGGVAGGLVGSNNASYTQQNATIENCFALGNVSGTYAGGMAGEARNYSSDYAGTSVIKNCYANNFVSGTTYSGGIVGYAACNYSVINSFYNSSLSSCSDTDRGTPKTSAQLQNSATYAGWGIGGMWNMATGVNNGYPYLRGLSVPEQTLSGDPASDFTYKTTNDGKEIQIIGYAGQRVDITIPASINGKPVTSIGNYAFQNNTNIISVVLPDTMQTINQGAFNGCSNLTDVDLGDGVKAIYNNAFSGCTQLKSIVIPASVTTMNSPFSGSGLARAEFELGKTSVPNSAFSGCTNLASVVIPIGINTIGREAFYGCTNLSEINLCNTIRTIERDAFYGCTALKYIYIPKNVTSMGSGSGGAFQNSGLETVEFESGITKIPDYSFMNCQKLTVVEIPGSAKTIGSSSFSSCTALNKLTIKNGVETISSSAFSHCTSLKSLVIPDSVTSILRDAFYYCTSLNDVELGTGVATIGYSAFGYCTALKYIYIPKNVTSLGSGSGGAFQNSGLETVEFESGITKIPDYSFMNCQKLTVVEIPGSAKTIGSSSFSSCTALNKLTIQNGVETISSSAFSHCTSLKSLVIPDSVTSISRDAFYYCTSLNDIELGMGVASIGYSAFGYCTALKYIYIPKNVTSMGSGSGGAFQYSGLETVEFESGITKIPDNSFMNCQKLASVVIPGSIKKIGSSAFLSCTALNKLTIKNGVEEISGSAFHGCTSLKSLEIPDSMTTISPSAFCGCISLNDVELGTGIKTIGRDAFYNCIALKYIYIPKNVTSMGSSSGGAFGYSGLETVEFESGITKIPDYSFMNCQKLITVKLVNGISSIGKSAFSGCTSLTNIIIPDSVKTISDSAFSGCSSLSDIDLGNGVETISSSAFNNCTSLKSIYIPSNVKTIGSTNYGAFEYSGLETVEFESGITSITNGALRNCYSLKTVVIPKSVASIGSNTFYGSTTNLTIYGYADSYAQAYAEANAIPFKLIVNATSIQVTPSSGTIYPSDNLLLTAKVLPEGATNDTVSWKSLNTDVAIVSGTGLVTAVAPGTAKIKVTSWDGGYTAYCEITVATPSISFQTNSVTMQVEDTFTLVATTTPADQIVTWSSSDSNVARIRNGVITARANGTATITATFEYGGVSYSTSCDVKVGNVSLSSISITSKPTKLTYEIGETLDTTGLSVIATYSDGSKVDVTADCSFSVFDSATAGTKTITVSYGGKSASFTVTVNKAAVTLTSISVTSKPAKTVYEIGESFSSSGMIITAKYSDGSTANVTDSCSISGFNSSTAGNKTITVSYEGKSTSFIVTVNEAEVTLSSIAVTSKPAKLTYETGEPFNSNGMVVTATYSDGSKKTIALSSCSITGFDSSSAGEKTVTVTYQRKSASFTVNVKEPSVDSDASICISTAKGSEGQKVSVTVNMMNNPGIVAAKIMVGYDSSKLKLVEVKNGDVITGGSFITSQTLNVNPYVVIWNDSLATKDYTANGTMLTLTFEIIEGAEIGSTPVTITCDSSSTFNQELKDVSFTTYNGAIEIVDRVVGDADGNGSLDLKDVAVIKRYLAEWDGYTINDANADVDGDSVVTLKDVALLERYLAGWDVTLK